MSVIKIQGRVIGPGQPCYVIAEISANHNQDIQRAIQLIHIAKNSGADAVKLQTYTPDTLTIDCNKDFFQLGNHPLWGGISLYELYKKAYTPWEWYPRLRKVAEEIGITLFSTPFDETAVDFLENQNAPAYKIASFELLDIPLLKKIANTGKPVIASTGMAEIWEIEIAFKTLQENGCKDIALLKCVSAYPAEPEEMHLHTIPDLKNRFSTVVGLSDHCIDNTVSIAAVCIGANIIEKHFTQSRSDWGPDSLFSLEPQELKQLIEQIRIAEKALGKVFYGCSQGEKESIKFRRSIFAIRDIKAGDELTSDNIRIIRPGYGLSPVLYDRVLGKLAARNLQRGDPLTEGCIVE